ncbi:MAG TPA: nucleoside-diphosphate kinase, partial [Candidatus Latescibacteria bacterium]|nr:nucleoside-diphosphate kinase [Candidatus Latescibacterota bacterium]
GFYAVHKQRPFFGDLVKFMTSGPVVVLVLQADNAIQRWRDLMGPTNSNDAPPGTIRGDFGTDVERNASHGSDAPETASVEISYFFNAAEIQAASEALA